jgi:hypothetical protein
MASRARSQRQRGEAPQSGPQAWQQVQWTPATPTLADGIVFSSLDFNPSAVATAPDGELWLGGSNVYHYQEGVWSTFGADGQWATA